MPRQNRVTPFGEIVAVPERGTMMGIRGILHDATAQHDLNARVRRRWAGRAWICCLLEFRGRRDVVMAPNHYTQLFFLDEPTALAAGHRPCAFCRRTDYLAFKAAWASGNAHLGLGPAPYATEIDRILHAERLGPGGTKRTYLARIADLPDGSFVALDPLPLTCSRERGTGSEGWNPYLRWQGALWRWTPGGYVDPIPVPDGDASVLTPPSTVAALAAGFTPFPPALPSAQPASPSPRQMAGPD